MSYTYLHTHIANTFCGVLYRFSVAKKKQTKRLILSTKSTRSILVCRPQMLWSHRTPVHSENHAKSIAMLKCCQTHSMIMMQTKQFFFSLSTPCPVTSFQLSGTRGGPVDAFVWFAHTRIYPKIMFGRLLSLSQTKTWNAKTPVFDSPTVDAILRTNVIGKKRTF